MKLSESFHWFAAGRSIWVFAIIGLELSKVLRRQGSVFLGYAWDIGTGIIDPGILRGPAFLEEDDVGLHALTVRGKSSARQAKDSMQVAVLHKNFKNLTCIVLKEAIVRKNDCSPSSAIKNVHNVLDKIKLLVARLYGKVFPLRGLICPLCAERWIGENAGIKLPPVWFID